jgi:translation initiation factor IF-2
MQQSIINQRKNNSKKGKLFPSKEDGSGGEVDGDGDEDDQFKIKILHAGVGPISQSDIELLAADSGTSSKTGNRGAGGREVKRLVVGFNVPPLAKDLTVLLRKYEIPLISQNIIYKLLDEVHNAASGMLKPQFEYEVVGEADVLAVFDISNGREKIAGCRVVEGTLFRGKSGAFEGNSAASVGGELLYKVMRQRKCVHVGELKSLKHHKNDVQSVPSGMECGLSFGDTFRDLQAGDRVVCVKKMKVT